MLKSPVTLKYLSTQQKPAGTLLKTIGSISYVAVSISSASPTNDHRHLNWSCQATNALPQLILLLKVTQLNFLLC